MAHRVHKSKLSERNPELKCRNECSFYGNPAWHGYCSVCYKKLYYQTSQTADVATEEHDAPVSRKSSLFGTDQASPNEETTLKFSKFEEKKKVQSGSKKQSVKRLFTKVNRGVSPVEQSSWSSKRSDLEDASSLEAYKNTSDFNMFLKSMRKPAAQDIVSKCKYVTSQILSNPSWTVERQSEFLQKFYVHMEERLSNHSAFRGTSPAQSQTALDGVEKYVMTRIYKTVFSPLTTNDELKDLELQKRIRQLKWVNAQHLDAAIDLENKEVQDLLEDAQNDILEIDTKRAPQDKLACIVRCSKRVFYILRLSSPDGSPASADEFLPCLIYIILKSHPTLLNSNIQYITRFCNANKLMSGESGYYFTNFLLDVMPQEAFLWQVTKENWFGIPLVTSHPCCAAKFIEMIDAKSLSLSEDEFNRYMSGEQPANTNQDQSSENEEVTCEGLKLMQQNLESLAELRERQLRWRQNGLKLQDELSGFKTNVDKEVHGILSGTSNGRLQYLQQYLDKDSTNQEKIEQCDENQGISSDK